MSVNSKLCHEGQQLYRQIRSRSQSLDTISKLSQQPAWTSSRYYASAATTVVRSHVHEQHLPTNGSSNKVPFEKAQQKEADREFFADLLSSAATKRDAKAYLSRLRSPAKGEKVKKPKVSVSGSYVNVGDLFRGSRAAEMSPVFSQGTLDEANFPQEETIHVALVKLKDIRQMSRQTLSGVAETLIQLNRLSLSPCVVVESSTATNRKELGLDVDTLLAAMNRLGNAARPIDSLFCTTASGFTKVAHRKLLHRPLKKDFIPVVLPLSYNDQTQRIELISAVDAVLALSREFTGLNIDDPQTNIDNGYTDLQNQPSSIALDRLIAIDFAGGISNDRAADGRHVFLNLEQEYDIVEKKLASRTDDSAMTQLDNLRMLKQALQLLPPTASGLMTTYEEAANHGRKDESTNGALSPPSSVGTRRQKNALIHNLLTDKPAYSASLPLGRLGKPLEDDSAEQINNVQLSRSSFVKRGMPLTIIPNPFEEPWTSQSPRLKLTDPRVDLARLVHLIDDSFHRKLDVEDYLSRVNDNIAGIIIAGEYEGGAILTWETPSENPSAAPVPYLDKFAVLQRSQGAGGVADIVFNAMVRSCFPEGVCWRSRRNNPVNKWYFERSAGTWKIDDHWCMFWTGQGIENDQQRFRDYISVCRGIQPTWVDKKKPAD